MKYLILLAFVFCTCFSFSQISPKEKDKKQAVGISASPIAFTNWFLPDYLEKVYDEKQPSDKHRYTLYSPTGISYQYIINNAIEVQTGAFATNEKQIFESYYLKVNSDLYKDVDYNINYLDIPLSFRFFPAHFGASEAQGGLFIQLGANFDFITHEKITSTTHSKYDHHFSFPPNYVDPNYKLEESNTGKIKFNRICPTLSLGQEIAGKRFTFFYGAYVQFASMYQKNNTLEYFRNIKFSLLNIGLSYRI
jgi:hypothetical protein